MYHLTLITSVLGVFVIHRVAFHTAYLYGKFHNYVFTRSKVMIGTPKIATYRSRIQFPAGRLSRDIGQLRLASLRGR